MKKGSAFALAASGMVSLLICMTAVAASSALERTAAVSADPALKRYVIELQDPPLALYDGRELSTAKRGGVEHLSATAPQAAGRDRLDMGSPAALAYLDFLADRQRHFRLEAEGILGRAVTPIHRYRAATNGMALALTEAEATLLAHSPLIRSIAPDTRHRLHTFAGPPWIGAAEVWGGLAGFPEARGEGVIVGVIDSGINWEHPSFGSPSADGYVYTNPYGEQLGLCNDPEVTCNDKLVGVYDFVEDDPQTPDVVEENTKGRDNDGHGSHVASIAVGNRVNVLFEGAVSATLSGVAPRATLVTYRACYVGEPAGADTGGCAGSAILAAIDQAVADGVDVINYSVGSSPSDPWAVGSIARAYLAARGAGIFVATSTGNEGPNPGTVGSPANAPWIVAVGNATHNQIFGFEFAIDGGPAGIGCLEGNGRSIIAGTGPKPVVFAGDVGSPRGCTAFDSAAMTGAIALIERGDCTFATKAANAEAAGADFMVVYNNVPGASVSMALSGSNISSCMISNGQGVAVRDHIQAEGDVTGRINYPLELFTEDAFADNVYGSSSRGPAQPPVGDVLKPNLIAPGTDIYAASDQGQEFRSLSGTSMASPHVAGAAAVLKSVHPDWGPSQLASAIEMTATAELAVVSGEPATPRDRGAGRPQLGAAANAGLYLNVTATQFSQANPASGGDPGALNLPGLVDADCAGGCSFTRSVTDLMGGGSWTATPIDFPQDVVVSVVPSSFTLANGASRSLTVDVDLAGSSRVGEWIDGRVRLSSAGAPDQFLTVTVFYSGGELPPEWFIADDRSGGWTAFELSGLAAMPDATLRSGGLQAPVRRVETLPEDPSNGDPYDGGSGVFTEWHELPQGALWLHAETLPSTAQDVDLFVGRDDNGNGFAEASEELCASTTPTDIERCDLFDQPAGNYWIVVQNWTASNDGFTGSGSDEVTLLSAGIGPGAGNNLAATGPGMVPAGAPFTVRLSWDDLPAVTGEEWLGAIGIGTSRDSPNNIGVIPVYFNRNGISEATFPLFDGVDRRLALDANGTHDRLFIDVPARASELKVSAAGLDPAHSGALTLELKRLDFNTSLANPPFAASPAGAAVVASGSGSGTTGPSVTVSGGQLQQGRWYAVLSNGNGVPVGVTVRAEVAFGQTGVVVHRGLWEPSSRPGLGQGYEYNWGGSGHALVWYTYDEAGQPAWYIAGAPATDYDIWTSPLYRAVNDGMSQQLTAVGTVSVTSLASNDALFSFSLFGQGGTERMQPLSAMTCPQVNGAPASYTGLWYRGVDGLGGASIVVNSATQAQIHYLYDAQGLPRWLVAQDPGGSEPNATDLPMLQFSGFCAVCAASAVSFEVMGTLQRSFDSESTGSWTLDYLFEPPLSGSVERTDPIVKLTDRLDCL